MNVSHEMDSNLNISSKVPCGVLSVMLLRRRIESYNFAIKGFVIKGGVIWAEPVLCGLF